MEELNKPLRSENEALDAPRTLEEALKWMAPQFSSADLRQFKGALEDGITISFHNSVGRQLRNVLNLWDEPRPALWHYFVNELKIEHPDDMSGILLLSFHRFLNRRPLEIEAQCCKYHEYWACYANKNRGVNMQGPK